MSVQIFKNVEESIAKEIRRITFHDSITVDKTILEETFDPFTGELIQTHIEPSFYDSSADANNIVYPHFFIRLLRSREDRFSGREVGMSQRDCFGIVSTSPRAFEIVISGSDGLIDSVGNDLKTTLFQINKIQPGYLLRILSGNNIGTYTIDSITPNDSSPHIITVTNILVNNLPTLLFSTSDRVITFEESVDLNTIKVGDIFTDNLAASFNITNVDINNNSITIDGVTTPSLLAGGNLNRSGNVFQNTDLSVIRFLILDPSKPITKFTGTGLQQVNSTFQFSSSEVPLDLFYLVRIDSKNRDNHIHVLNRMWEEFNPPRTGLPVIVRSKLSAEQELTQDITIGGSTSLSVSDNTSFNINDNVFIFDDLLPTKNGNGGFSRPFQSKVISKTSTNNITLKDTIPDTFTINNNSRIVSNAEFRIYMFNFVDHITKDIEGSQYWIHEFIYWVQVWIDRLEDSEIRSAIHDIATPIEDIEGNVIIED